MRGAINFNKSHWFLVETNQKVAHKQKKIFIPLNEWYFISDIEEWMLFCLLKKTIDFQTQIRYQAAGDVKYTNLWLDMVN